ncbi:MAG TPA: phosphatidylinositol mannoside acyltransferase [Actinomycetes bacterium]|nr:phosphatidylinositol mannoside acyltransferase [Actinomycetes bacterium]
MSEERARARRQRRAVRAWLVAWELVKLIPEPLARALARVAGAVAYRRDARRRENLRANLRPVLGRAGERALDAAVRRGFASYARYWVEAFRLERLSPAVLRERFTLEGREHLDEALAGGRGVVLATPHLGNWESGGAWLALEGYRAVAVAERLRPVELFERFRRYRETLGLEIIPLDDGPATVRRVATALRAGKVAALVADRDLTGRGLPVTMFGRTATLPAGPAALALRTGAALLPCAVYQEPRGRWRGVILPAPETPASGDLRADTLELTRRLARALEQLVAAAPEQWHVLVPYWADAPGGPAGGTRRAGPAAHAERAPAEITRTAVTRTAVTKEART